MAQLTNEQKENIRASWAIVEKGDLTDHGIVMFKSLFTENPKLQDLFKGAYGVAVEDLGKNAQMRRHVKGVVDTVGVAVGSLDDLSKLEPTLIDLGAKHFKRKVVADHFQPVGAALLYMLEQACGNQFTPGVKESWVALYAVVVKSMSDGLKQQENQNKA